MESAILGLIRAVSGVWARHGTGATSMSLIEMFEKASARPVLQREVDNEVSEFLQAKGMKKWHPGDPIPGVGRRMLIGLATYSRDDIDLAQALVDHKASGGSGVQVELFSVMDIRTMQEFEEYIPGIGNVYQTPVAGLWEDGVVIRTSQGLEARKLIDDVILSGGVNPGISTASVDT
jgi:hypothetical protein